MIRVKRCSNCDCRKRLYEKCVLRHWKICGRNKIKWYCVLRDKALTDDIGCDNWQSEAMDIDFSPKRFDEAERDIKFMIDYAEKRCL